MYKKLFKKINSLKFNLLQLFNKSYRKSNLNLQNHSLKSQILYGHKIKRQQVHHFFQI